MENQIKHALYRFRWESLRHDATLPYDRNPVRTINHPCDRHARDAVMLMYRHLGCAAVFRGKQMWTIGREQHAMRAWATVRKCHRLGADLERLVKWCLQSHTWDVKPTPAQLRDYVSADKVAWAVVAQFPKLRDYSYPEDPVLLPRHGGLSLGGILPVHKI